MRRIGSVLLGLYAVFAGVPAVMTNSLSLGVIATVSALLAIYLWPRDAV